MKSVPFLLMTALLAGCASTAGSRDDLARYGTAPSEDDLYQMMSQYRDTLPPTRYVSYRDKGYADSVKKVSYTDEQGQFQHGWEYDFEVASYDTMDKASADWSPRRVIFFNGRPLRIVDQAGSPIRLESQAPPSTTTTITPTPTPSSTSNPRR
ncbi:hypothetical protein [Bordetella sp. BOR01]|uniref:hypothetical protein n=1 Tax=Bordetella sp. BOR01 TaxID=2854779 RepID=UPI001C461A26|nr:hypothetical protein [Bordetella sp. BOR01]MBV7486061.1 hypothetical protein [Bordetella sp. BOR01]